MTAPTDPQLDPQPVVTPAFDPFDLTSLRLTGAADQTIGTKKVLTTVPVRKPDKSWFVRSHPDPEYTFNTVLLDMKEDREVYLVASALWPVLVGEPLMKAYRLVTTVNRQGVTFLWSLRLPGPDGKIDPWGESALQAAEEASRSWVRVTSNMSLGGYEVTAATGVLSEPAFPTEPFQELLRVAFRGKLIDSADHPVLKKLRGDL